MNQRQRKREAKFRAGLILESTINNGWEEGAAEQYGEETATQIASEILEIASRLIESSGPKAP